MQNYCTLFDSFYLSRGLAMYYSLKKHLKEFHLYIFAFDDLCFSILQNEQLEHTTIISLDEFENEELLAVKPHRSKAEYCWTSTPATVQYVLNNFKVPSCTYIDSDLYFFNNPEILENEMDINESVLVTEHRYSKLAQIYEEKRAGKFCVQYITFRNDTPGKQILNDWGKQCIDWCYNRYEDGKFGDQKYLDVWPDKYQGIHILNNHGGGLAPWNVQQYTFKKSAFSFVRKKNKEEYQLVFYHFHFVRFMENGKIDIGWHKIPTILKEQIYLPYINEIIQYETYLSEKYPDYTTSYMKTNSKGIKNFIKNIFKFVSNYNLIRQDSI